MYGRSKLSPNAVKDLKGCPVVPYIDKIWFFTFTGGVILVNKWRLLGTTR